MKIALPVFKPTFHHIGSTAVPGLAAKDIIDIQVSVSCFDPQIETPHNIWNRIMTSLQTLASVTAKTLILTGDKDVATLEHTLKMHQLIEGSDLMIIPGGHGDYLGEITTLKAGSEPYRQVTILIERFLLA